MYALLRALELLLAQRDALGSLTVVPGGPAHQCAAADVEQMLPRPQPELATDVVPLVALRLIQRLVGTREVGAGVNAFLIESQAVELI